MKKIIDQLKMYACNDTSLRPYQFDYKLKVYSEWAYSDSVMLQMPTGTGKTRLFSSVVNDIFLCSMYYGCVKRVLLIAHRTELVFQISNTLASYGLEHGIILSGTPENTETLIQVASVYTLSRRLESWGNIAFDFIIIDEAHHAPAQTYMTILDFFTNAKLLGVTATPHRLDGWGFAHIFDKLIVSPSPMDFIKSGFLSDYDYYSVSSNNPIIGDIDSLPTEMGDFAENALVNLLDSSSIRAQVVDSYIKFASGKQGIVYTINKAHNYHLCEEYNHRGIKAVAIDSDTSAYDRKKLLGLFKEGKIQIICNVNLFTEGFDCPGIEVVQLVRPTLSLAMYLQQVGRGLRICPNKDRALFIDNVGLYLRFGLPSHHRNWEKYFNRQPINIIQSTSERDERIPRTEKSIEEGNEEVRLVYSTTPPKAADQTAETSNTPKTVNKKLAPILLLASYL